MGFWIFMLICTLMLPVFMIILGNVFVKHPPETINNVYGYRTTMSRKNQETWDFAHNYCGKLWIKIGWILLPVSFLIMLPTLGKGDNPIGFVGGTFTLLQCLVLIGSIFPVEYALKKRFDKDGNRIGND